MVHGGSAPDVSCVHRVQGARCGDMLICGRRGGRAYTCIETTRGRGNTSALGSMNLCNVSINGEIDGNICQQTL